MTLTLELVTRTIFVLVLVKQHVHAPPLIRQITLDKLTVAIHPFIDYHPLVAANAIDVAAKHIRHHIPGRYARYAAALWVVNGVSGIVHGVEFLNEFISERITATRCV